MLSFSGVKPWTYLTEIMSEKNGSDTELLIYTMTLINKVNHRSHTQIYNRDAHQNTVEPKCP